jgi:phosphatidylserine decarboxylase
MSKHFIEWLNKPEIKNIIANSPKKSFLKRTPSRICFQNVNFFYSPADGTIVYQKILDNFKYQSIVSIKQRDLDLQNITQIPTFNKPSIIIGIFCSTYDVHVMRLPYSGIVNFVDLKTNRSNQNMSSFETKYIKGNIDLNEAEYLFTNQKRIYTIVNSILNYTYYIIQTLSAPIENIESFIKSKTYCNQNTPLSLFPYANHIDLVLPLDTKFEFQLQQGIETHVKAGLDRIVKIKLKNN